MMSSHHATFDHLKSRLQLGLAINAVIILTEFIGGYWINSLGLMSDAGHNLVDQGSLFLALYAHTLAARPATRERTFGYHRAGIVAAFVNGLILLVTAGVIGALALYRLAYPVAIQGEWMIGIAAVSFVANLAVALLLQRGAQDDLNIRGAFWHMLADAWVSLGVVACGIGILYTDWLILDPLISVVTIIVILRGAWPIFRESLDILLESAPPGINTQELLEAIERIDGVHNVHDLHVWALEPRMVILTCHILVTPESSEHQRTMLKRVQAMIIQDFDIHHHTIQLETVCTESDTIHCDLSRFTHNHQLRSHAHSHTD